MARYFYNFGAIGKVSARYDYVPGLLLWLKEIKIYLQSIDRFI